MTAVLPPVPDATEDADVLALVEGSRLTAKQRRFCWEFLHGETAGNAMRSYIVAYGNPNEKTAGPAADALLKDANIQHYLGTLREQALARVNEKLRPWGDLVEEAQGIVLAIMRGHLRSRLMLDAASAVLDRALGKPPQRLEHELLRDESRVRKALVAHARRRETEATVPIRADILTSPVRSEDAQLLATIPALALQPAQHSPDTLKGSPQDHGKVKVKYR